MQLIARDNETIVKKKEIQVWSSRWGVETVGL